MPFTDPRSDSFLARCAARWAEAHEMPLPRAVILEMPDGTQIRVPLPPGFKVPLDQPRGAGGPSPPPPPRRTHAAGFQSLTWDGVVYTFTPAQAKAVAKLWAAYEDGSYAVRGKDLLDAAGSICDKVSDLFKHSSAWNTLIISAGRRGIYRLRG